MAFSMWLHIIFLLFIATPSSCQRVSMKHRRGKVFYPKTLQHWDPKINKSVTVHMEVDPNARESRFNPKEDVNFYISISGQGQVYIDLRNIGPQTPEIRPSALWFFGIHGWLGNIKASPILEELVSAIWLDDGRSNVVHVDWEKGASSHWYPTAVGHVKAAAEEVADVIQYLVKRGAAQRNRIYLIGFSLGGQVVGFVGKFLWSKYNWKPERIISLDPAGPHFEDEPASNRIDSKDGKHVEVYHTAGNMWGYWEPVANADFYVNRGKAPQPGCGWDLTGECSHQFAKDVYCKYTQKKMKPFKCKNFKEFTSGYCKDGASEKCVIGFNASACPHSVYHLVTDLYFQP